MKKTNCCKHTFSIADKTVTVYPALAPNRPVVYLNAVSAEDGRLSQTLSAVGCPDFTLVVISNLAWNHDMTPWRIPTISENDIPCTGGADEYLKLLTTEIIPEAEKDIPGPVLWRGLAGYSLAGLFALYSLYHTDAFSRFASISGSLWFPGFQEYVFTQEMKRPPTHLYLSLGDRECKTNHPYRQTVLTHTQELHAFYENSGIDTMFTLNPGGHFKNTIKRTAAGISWIVSK